MFLYLSNLFGLLTILTSPYPDPVGPVKLGLEGFGGFVYPATLVSGVKNVLLTTSVPPKFLIPNIP